MVEERGQGQKSPRSSQRRARWGIWCLAGFAGLVILGVLLAASGLLLPEDKTAFGPRPGSDAAPIRIEASELLAAFKSNGVAAKQRYQGQALRVRGAVDTIDGGGFIVLGGPDGVQCMFPPSDRAALARLHQGDVVEVVGKIDGHTVQLIPLKLVLYGCHLP